MAHETISDKLFGSLAWDSEHHQWRGRAITARGLGFDLWIETGVRDMIPPYDDAKVERAISSASREAFVRACDLEQSAREGLVAEFVPLHADWHGEQITPADFQARLQSDCVQIHRDGGMLVFYDDDGMFGGHSLIAHMDSSGAFGAYPRTILELGRHLDRAYTLGGVTVPHADANPMEPVSSHEPQRQTVTEAGRRRTRSNCPSP